jgi:hypothetical protein
MILKRWRAWRRRRGLFDWHRECPELIDKGGHVRHVAGWRSR